MATTTTLQPRPGTLVPGQRPNPLPAIPWRDPHSVPPEKLAEFITALQQACVDNPDNADLHTCLGMAHAMNYDVYRSMDALEGARRIEPENFLAQFKYAELYYREPVGNCRLHGDSSRKFAACVGKGRRSPRGRNR